MRRAAHRRGFTLVELMIVVAIIGVLAALAIYGVRKYLASAKSAEARQHVGSISRAAQAAFAREQAPSQLIAPGSTSSTSNNILCNGASAPVPAMFALVKGVKYTPSDTPGKDYNTGSFSDGWICLKFLITTAQYYQYNYAGGVNPGTSIASNATGAAPPLAAGGPTSFLSEASGDLNGDGVASYFQISGQVDTTTKQLYIATTIYEYLPDE